MKFHLYKGFKRDLTILIFLFLMLVAVNLVGRSC